MLTIINLNMTKLIAGFRIVRLFAPLLTRGLLPKSCIKGRSPRSARAHSTENRYR